MNELKIWCHGGPLIYFATKKESVEEAFVEFQEICERVQINIDNLLITELVLQDANFNEIGKMFY